MRAKRRSRMNVVSNLGQQHFTLPEVHLFPDGEGDERRQYITAFRDRLLHTIDRLRAHSRRILLQSVWRPFLTRS